MAKQMTWLAYVLEHIFDPVKADMWFFTDSLCNRAAFQYRFP